MKKISQISWKRYKESPEGKAAIDLFGKIYCQDVTMEDIFQISKLYNPEFFKNASKKEEQACLSAFAYYDDIVGSVLEDDIKFENGDDYVIFFEYLSSLLSSDDGALLEDIPQSNFKQILSDNTFLSMILCSYLPEFFIPNLFVMQFIYLKKFAEKYDIELPEIPHRSDYKDRWMYYLDLCIIINNFANENGLDSTAEICAFIYDYELPLIREELDADGIRVMPKESAQAWILVGNYGEGEKDMNYGFWQANELTEKGDILLFYEKSPVKALNSVWIAQQDGVVDPFFYYYSNTYIGNKISIPPHQSVLFEDFKNSEYFKSRDKKGNFVSKNFQDVSGWAVRSDDYNEIKRILASKGFDTSILPQL